MENPIPTLLSPRKRSLIDLLSSLSLPSSSSSSLTLPSDPHFFLSPPLQKRRKGSFFFLLFSSGGQKMNQVMSANFK